jgi:predicted O-methyltransferase YrrM
MASSFDWKLLVGIGAATVTVSVASIGALYYMARRREEPIVGPGETFLKNYGNTDDPVDQYLIAHNVENATLSRLRAMSIAHTKGLMTSSVEVNKLLTILCISLKACKVIDLGVFTGCSSFAMALGLPPEGKVIACDVSMEYPQLGQPFWIEGGVDDKIDLRIQPALKTLQDLIDNGESGTFDLIFIDAHKPEYPEYFKKGLVLLRAGGMFVVDNAIWRNKVADQSIVDEKTEGIRRINRLMCDSESVEYTLLNFSDGIGLAVKL